MPQDPVLRRRGAISATRLYQLPAPQSGKGCLDRGFGKAGIIGYGAKTGRNRSPTAALRLTVEIEIYQERSRLTVMADQVGQQDVDHIIIDWNNAPKSRHKQAG
jgi:hypothetical protein